jgi:hypothetical protein
MYEEHDESGIGFRNIKLANSHLICFYYRSKDVQCRVLLIMLDWLCH